MKEVFKIDGETLESVQQTIRECKNKILSHKPSHSLNSGDFSFKDVQVEVISYKDNYVSEQHDPAEVTTVRLPTVVQESVTLTMLWRDFNFHSSRDVTLDSHFPHPSPRKVRGHRKIFFNL